jgi:hypothetical protein
MSNTTAIDFLSNWFPLLLLVGVWIFFMRQTRGADSPQQQALAEQKRHNAALESILASHEARLQEIEEYRRSQISN